MSRLRYVVVSPIRNEEEYLSLTIRSMCAQSVKPLKWVLVDDGSSDGTGALIDEAASQHPWIAAIHRNDRGSRQAGTGVIEAFYEGYALVANDEWDLIAKLDGDLSFGGNYFRTAYKSLRLT